MIRHLLDDTTPLTLWGGLTEAQVYDLFLKDGLNSRLVQAAVEWDAQHQRYEFRESSEEIFSRAELNEFNSWRSRQAIKRQAAYEKSTPKARAPGPALDLVALGLIPAKDPPQ